MRSKFTGLALAVTLTLLAVVPGTAAPLHSPSLRDFVAGPCVAGASYDPVCDVNHDGVINVLDIQLAAGHWNQTGTWTSDNDHNHLGQTWTGNGGSGLKLEGSFGGPDNAPVELSNSAGIGVRVVSAGGSGVHVVSAGGGHGVSVGSAGVHGVYIHSTVFDGVAINSAGLDGVAINSAGDNGVRVEHAVHHGVSVGNPGWDGLFVESAGDDGIHIATANDEGVYVGTVGGDGLYVHSAFYSGLVVNDAGNDGVLVREASNWAGRFIGNVSVSGTCSGCRQANFALNSGDRVLQPGDAVNILAVTPASFDAATILWQVTQAQPGQAVVGVVAGRAELVADERDEEEGDPAGEPGQHLAPREGAALPGEYLTVVYSGPMQVRVAPGESALAAGARVTSAADGAVRPLATRTVDGMVVSEGAPVLGIALEPAQDGLVWVLVNPQ
jgi:hypothetical protein